MKNLHARHLLDTIATPRGLAGYSAAWALDERTPVAPRVTLLTDLADARRRPPAKAALQLWVGAPRGSAADLLASCADILPAVELARARRLRQECDAAAFLAAHAGLRLLMAAALGCEPAALRFGATAYGKPFLDAVDGRAAPAGLHFNLSHSADRVLVGIAAAPIGVDIEQVRDLPDRAAIADLVFSREILDALSALRGDEQTAAFYRMWVLGEAFIKATGLGISQGLDIFSFTTAGPPRLTAAGSGWGPPERWRFGLLGC